MKRVQVAHIGAGTVGGAAIEQELDNRARWQQTHGVDVVVAAVLGTGGAVVAADADGIPEAALRAIAAGRRSGTPVAEVARQHGLAVVDNDEALVRAAGYGTLIGMDAGAGDAAATLDARILALGGSVVLSNKAPLALPAGTAGDALWAECGPLGRMRYEATCGAGLPVISTLRSLLDTGDAVIEISGTVSGTLGAIFSDVAKGLPFSEAVAAAKANGYTEPDPRDDLSGLDVARKALILARTLGRKVALTDIAVESLVPASLTGVPVPEFMAGVSIMDADIAARAAAASAAGQALKYVATVRPEGPISVGIAAVSTKTVLGALQGPENIVSFRTARYDAYPLVVSGPGAGAAVTAAGMTADLLALASR